VAAALLGLALALALPALHATAAGSGVLIQRWWPLILLWAGLWELVVQVRRRRSLLLGGAVAAIGAALLADRFGLPAGPLLLAVLLVAAALALVGAPRWWRALWSARRLAGEIRLGGPGWRVDQSAQYQWVGQLCLDLTDVRLSEGVTPLRLGMFAGQVEITVPQDVGVRATARAFAGELFILGHEAQGLWPQLTVESDDYRQLPRRVDLEIEVWAGEVRVRRRG